MKTKWTRPRISKLALLAGLLLALAMPGTAVAEENPQELNNGNNSGGSSTLTEGLAQDLPNKGKNSAKAALALATVAQQAVNQTDATQGLPQKTPMPPALEGKSTPTFTKGGPQEVSAAQLEALIASQKGKALLVVYWASWCTPCKHYAEKLAALRRDYPQEDLDILGVSMDADKKMLKRFLESHEMPFKPVLADEKLYEKMAGTPIPTTVLYGKDGAEVRSLKGNVDEKRLKHYVKKLFE